MAWHNILPLQAFYEDSDWAMRLRLWGARERTFQRICLWHGSSLARRYVSGTIHMSKVRQAGACHAASGVAYICPHVPVHTTPALPCPALPCLPCPALPCLPCPALPCLPCVCRLLPIETFANKLY
jgi:hypothetical protein